MKDSREQRMRPEVPSARGELCATGLNASVCGALGHVAQREGAPLEPSVRAIMEPRFGHNFANVRVYADHQDARIADAMEARAFNIGSDLVFNRGEYQPETLDGRAVLAHELTHVVQRERFGWPTNTLRAVAGSGDASEAEAHDSSASVLAGQNVSVSSPTTGFIARLPQGAASSVAAPTLGDPQAAAASSKRYNINIAKVKLNNLDADTTAQKLRQIWNMISENEIMEGVHKDFLDSNRAVRFASDLLGGADLPDYDEWGRVYGSLNLALMFLPLTESKSLAPDVRDKFIHQVMGFLTDAARARDSLNHRLEAYSHDTVKGAERAVTGLEAVRDTSKMVVDVASGGKLGALYGGVQQVAQQTSEVAYGQRDSVDFKGIAVDVAVDQLTGKITGKLGAGNAVAKKFGGSAAGKIAGKIAGHVVDQKVESAVGIGTKAVVTNAAGLENAPSISQVGSQLWDTATSLDAGEMAKSYAMGRVAKGVAGTHSGAHGSSGKANEDTANSSSAPHDAAPMTLDAGESASPPSPSQPQVVAAQTEAVVAKANQAHAALEAHEANAAQSVNNVVETGDEAPARMGEQPASLNEQLAPRASSVAPDQTHVGASPLADGAQTIPDMPAITATDIEPVMQRLGAVEADGEVTQVTPAPDREVTRAYTAEEKAQLGAADTRFGHQDAADAMVAQYGPDLENFQNLPEARRHVIIAAQNEELHRRFTADHDGTGRPESPDVTFMQGADPARAGQMLWGRNAIQLNNASPYNASLTGAEGTGMAGTHAHEFGHVQQERQAANPEGFIDPAYGRQMADNKRHYVTAEADYQGYRDQPMESDARTWGQEYNEAVNRSLEQRRQSAVTQEMPAVTVNDVEPVTQRIPTSGTDFDNEPTLVTSDARASRAAPTDDKIADQVMREGREIRGDAMREKARELKRPQISEEVQSGIRSPEIQMLEDDIGRDTLVALADGEIGYRDAGVEVNHKMTLELGHHQEDIEALEKNAHRRGFHNGDFGRQRGGVPGNPDFDKDVGFTGIGDASPLRPHEIEAGIGVQSVNQWRELETLRDALEDRDVPSIEGERERKGRGSPRLTEAQRTARETAQTDRGILDEYRRLAAFDPRIAAALSALEALLGGE